jgi:hypothetical protein
MSVHLGIPLDLTSTTADFAGKIKKHAERLPDPTSYFDEVMKAQHLSLGAIGLWFHRHYAGRPYHRPPPAYDVFRLFPDSSTIISWNYDGLAARYVAQRVIVLHGEASAQLAAVHYRQPLGRSLSLIDRSLPMPDVLPYEPECDSIRTDSRFQSAWRAVAQSGAIVLVGYSFGGGADAISRQSFLDNVPQRVPVHVVDPFRSTEVRDDVGAGLGRIGRHVNIKTASLGAMAYAHPLSWPALASALIRLAAIRGVCSVAELIGHEEAIIKFHDEVA